jgi:tetratricopeptide (TPR) repeat protein
VTIKLAALVLATTAVLWAGKKRTYLTAGWLWYLVTLLPVIGLVRIGQQEMADRYTYVPLVGVFWMLAWSVAELADAARAPALARRVAATAALLVGVLLALGTTRQVATWRNGITLWEHAVAVGGNSTVARTNLGVALEKVARYDEAVTHLEEAVRLEPRNARAQLNLGDARFALQRYPEAIQAYEAALRLDPADSLTQLHLAMTHYNYANHEWHDGRLEVAVEQYREGLRWRPDDAGFHRALGMALAQQGHVEEAAAAFRRSLELDPTNVFTRNALEKLPREAVMR